MCVLVFLILVFYNTCSSDPSSYPILLLFLVELESPGAGAAISISQRDCFGLAIALCNKCGVFLLLF